MRDYNDEFQDNKLRQYAYDFDNVLREYMMQTLAPFLQPGKALELGCFDGTTTKLYGKYYKDITVIEASGTLIEQAKKNLPADVKFIHSTIETAVIKERFDSIFLVHTLEHLDDAVGALKRIGEWLNPMGRLFVVVPNANAASRQIAVRMGVVDTNHAITEGERVHGHRATYSLDTLEYTARKAGLTIETRGGIFFKPFANFQFDLLLKHKVIDKGYLDGCYALGMQYPDLSASVFLVCKQAV